MFSVRALSLAIHGESIVEAVSFDIGSGEIFGVVGESGSGKSLTALAMMRLLPEGAAVRGKIALDGRELLTLSEREMCGLRGRALAMISQEPMTALNPVMAIGDQVAEALLIHHAAGRREARRIARERLDRVGLARIALGRYPHELSGGQRQRVAIAMAIALRPQLLIADEPTTALDVTTQAQILTLLKELVREEGMALMLITHDLAVVAGMADRVAVMERGRIVEQGPTEALFCSSKTAYTARLLAASAHVPRRAGEVTEIPLLEVRDAVRDYPMPRSALFGHPAPLRAVDGISFTLRRGESLGLVGESGCGKSTLARAILGLEPLQGGEIRLAGASVRAGETLPHSLRRRMQVVFQDPYGSFDPRHRVARLVAEPFHLLDAPPRDARERVAEALASVGLVPADMEKFPHEFSGGQRQRIAIARALVLRPDLIVLDEAVSALDVSIRAQILDLLADLQTRLGLTYLFITHDLSVVRAITDRVLVMRAGKIVEQGATRAVLDTPAQAYTKSLMAAVPAIPPAWQRRHDDQQARI